MKSIAARHLSAGVIVMSLLLATHAAVAAKVAAVQTFASPQQAASALIAAATRFDVPALERLFGPTTKTVILSNEPAQDRQRARDFVAKAREKQSVTISRNSIIGFEYSMMRASMAWSIVCPSPSPRTNPSCYPPPKYPDDMEANVRRITDV